MPEDANKPVDEQTEKINRRRNKQQRQREYFVKWQDQSYWKCDWVSEVQVNIFYLYILCSILNHSILDGSFSSNNHPKLYEKV